MPKNLCRSLNQLALTQVKHKSGGGKLLDCFKHVLEHLFLSIPVYGYVVQVDDYRQGMVIWPTT